MDKQEFSCPKVAKFRRDNETVLAVQFTGDNENLLEIRDLIGLYNIEYEYEKDFKADEIKIRDGLFISKGQILVKDSVGYFAIWKVSHFLNVHQPITE